MFPCAHNVHGNLVPHILLLSQQLQATYLCAYLSQETIIRNAHLLLLLLLLLGPGHT